MANQKNQNKDGSNRSQALYRKWRSQTFGELLGQEAITRTLKNAISSQRIGHAYLFCGPRGTGKTSMARLLAKAVNCGDPDPINRPCNRCEACLSIAEGRAVDLIEIDAASNNGVDNVRDLREKIGYQPAQLKKKVYIIDEVHMLTDSAFNALLKTLEEPPPHAMFILATTDPQDIPATVVSRCQRFDFQLHKLDTIVERLSYVSQEEDIAFDPAALEVLARQSTGSLRDALSLLDQIIVYSGGNITLAAVNDMLGVSNIEAVADFTEALVASDLAQGLEQISKLVQSGSDLKRFNRELVDYLRGIMLVKARPNEGDLLNMTSESLAKLTEQAARVSLADLLIFLKIFSTVDYGLKVSPYAQLPLEIALMEAVLQQPEKAYVERPRAQITPSRPVAVSPSPLTPVGGSFTPDKPTPIPVGANVTPAKPLASVEANSNLNNSTTIPIVESSVQDKPAASLGGSATPDKSAPDVAADGLELDQVFGAWLKLMDYMSSINKMTHALLREARPVAVRGNQISLAFKFSFHRDKVAQDKTRSFVEEQFSKVLGQAVVIRCLAEEQLVESNAAKAANKLPDKIGRYAQHMNAIVTEKN